MTEEITQTIQQISEKVNDTYLMMGALLALGLAILIIFSIRSIYLCIEQDKKQAQQEREQLKKDIQEAIEVHERKRRIREEFDGCSEDFMEELETLFK